MSVHWVAFWHTKSENDFYLQFNSNFKIINANQLRRFIGNIKVINFQFVANVLFCSITAHKHASSIVCLSNFGSFSFSIRLTALQICEFGALGSLHDLFVEIIMKCTMPPMTETCLQVSWQTLLIVVCWFFGLDEIPILSNRQTKRRTKAISSIKDDYYLPVVHKRVGCVACGRMLIHRNPNMKSTQASVKRRRPDTCTSGRTFMRFLNCVYMRFYANTRTHNK